MTDIIHIRSGKPVEPQRPEPDPNVVELLEKMLAHAKDGRLQAVVAIGWNADNSIASGWSGAHKACFTLLGAIEEVKLEYTLKEFQRR